MTNLILTLGYEALSDIIYLIVDRPAGFSVHNVLSVFTLVCFCLILNQLKVSFDLCEYPVIILAHS